MSILGNRGRSLETLEGRIRTLEGFACAQGDEGQNSRPVGQTTYRGGELEELTQEAKRITEQAKTTGDFRTALASIRVRCDILELTAKVRGELDDRSQTNILNVHLDSETAKRIAETYLARLRKPEAK